MLLCESFNLKLAIWERPPTDRNSVVFKETGWNEKNNLLPFYLFFFVYGAEGYLHMPDIFSVNSQ